MKVWVLRLWLSPRAQFWGLNLNVGADIPIGNAGCTTVILYLNIYHFGVLSSLTATRSYLTMSTPLFFFLIRKKTIVEFVCH